MKRPQLTGVYQTLDVDLWLPLVSTFDIVCDVDCKDVPTLKALPNGGYKFDDITISLSQYSFSEDTALF